MDLNFVDLLSDTCVGGKACSPPRRSPADQETLLPPTTGESARQTARTPLRQTPGFTSTGLGLNGVLVGCGAACVARR